MFKKSPEAFAAFIEKLPIAIACFNEERKFFAINDACIELNGVDRESTMGKSLDEVVPDLVDVLTPIFDKVYLHGESTTNTLVEGKTPASDKLRYWMASYQPLPLSDGKMGLLVTAEEVTQQVFANKTAESNRKLLTDVLNSLFTFVGLLDPNGILIDANKAPLDAAGISLDDVVGKYFWECYWWTYSTEASEKIKQAIESVKEGNPVRFDIEVRVSEGFITIDFMMEGLKNKKGELIHIIPSAIDISERKEAENLLKLSQARFESVTNRTVDGLVACDDKGVIHFVNKRFEELIGDTVEINKASIYEYFDEVQVLNNLDSLIQDVKENGVDHTSEKVSSNLYRDICSLKSTHKFVDIAFSPFVDDTKVLFLATVSDVSALYDANRALEKALQEKTILLNEVHHRVKNNLQVMSSLLSLQAESVGTNSTTKEALLDSQRRLKSMALIHQLLYERDDFTHANLQQFTNRLLGLLKDSMANGDKVELLKKFTPTPILLNLNQIVPFGFLLTELITNSFKHAFESEKTIQPSISVSMEESNETIKLVVSDNGGGFCSEEAATKQSLGRDLINIFSRQLHAELETSSSSGVTHILKFKKQTAKE